MGDVKKMFDSLDDVGKDALLLQLLLVSCAYLKKKRLDSPNPKTPEKYVHEALGHVAVGIYGPDTHDQSLFEFLAAAIRKRIDHDAERRPAA
jgi:hypothetical protein